MRKRNFFLAASPEVTQIVNSNAATYNTQSTGSKISATVAKLTGTAAAVVQVVPGIGTAVGAVLGIVSVASGLVSKIIGTSKAKKLAAQRKEWEKVNKQLQAENSELDAKIAELKTSIQKVKTEISAKSKQLYPEKKFAFSNSLGLNVERLALTNVNLSTLKVGMSGIDGLGLCIFGCKKKEEQKKLKLTKQEYEELSSAQAEKIAGMNELMEDFNRAVEESKLVDQKILDKARKEAEQKQKQAAVRTNLKVGSVVIGSLLLLSAGVVHYRKKKKLKYESV